MISEEKIFEYFFGTLPFMLPWQPTKFSDLDKIHLNRRGLLKKHFCKKNNLNICSETAKIANFHFSHFKSMEIISCLGNQSSYPIGTKNNIFVPPTYRCYVGNVGFMASEEMSFENVDDRRLYKIMLHYLILKGNITFVCAHTANAA